MPCIKTTCPYCGVGCGVSAQVENAQVIAVSGDETHSANYGRLCVKGTALHETFSEDERLLHPVLNGAQTSWDTAIETLANQLQSTLEQHGPESIAFYLSGQLLTEDYYVANKLMKGFLGSANVDTNSRLCMSSAVSAHKRAFGEDIVPVSYNDVEIADLLVMTGSNAAWSHPVLFQRVAKAKEENPNKRVVVIDVRKTATCDLADLYLEIAPGSDGFLFSGLLKYLSDNAQLDSDYIAQHTENFQECITATADMSVAAVSSATGVSQDQLLEFYALFAATPRTVTLFSQGINQSETGTDKGNAIINCHLATGRIGQAGAGPFSITGQPNAMGGREVGGLATQLAAHRGFAASDIDAVGRFWNATNMAQTPGRTAVDLFDDMASGKIKFLWVMATNPAVSLPDTAQVRKALSACDFVVASDCNRETDTNRYANLLLPAQGWGEKDGTVTNSERVISRQRALISPPGEAKADWRIISEVACKLGFDDAFAYQCPADIFREHAALSGFENNGARAFDISAFSTLSNTGYDALEPVRWPCPSAGTDASASPLPENRRYPTPSGRARFVTTQPKLPTEEGELIVNTGRLRDQWHTMTRTGSVARLARHREFFGLRINPADAQAENLLEGDIAQLKNARGVLRAQVEIDEGQPVGQVFAPIHWNREFASNGAVNVLLPPIVDAVSGQPQSKYTRATLTKLEVNSWAVLFSRDKPTLPALSYWSRIAVPNGHLTLIAERRDNDWLTKALENNELESRGSCATYEDQHRNEFRKAYLVEGQLHQAFYVAKQRGDLPMHSWLRNLGSSDRQSYADVLAGFESGATETGNLICSCWEVEEGVIRQAIAQGAESLEALGNSVKCGTACGSCIPELKQILSSELQPEERIAVRQ